MKTVELIVCHDAGWDNGIYVDIPIDLHEARDVDEIAFWVQENLDVIHKDATYIGVYNWEPEQEDIDYARNEKEEE